MYETNSFSATTSKAVQETHRSMRKNTYISLAFFVLIFVGVTLYSYITGATDIVAACDDKVLGAYGADITVFAQYTDIQSAELMESVDFGERLTGEEHKGALIGTFRSLALGECTVLCYENVPQVIVVRHSGGVLAVNCRNEKMTRELYQTLMEHLNGGQ